VLQEWLSSLPRWLTVGLALGLLASLVVAGVFYLGGRLFPGSRRADGARGDAARVDGDAKRRAEIRSYLRAIGEPFAEDRDVEGESVAFYLPPREVAITFDARAYFRLRRAGVRVVLCEHEMPGAQLGRRLPFDVSEPDWGPAAPDAAPDPVATAFDRLDLPPTATEAEVRAAYRDRVKETHPDRGGDEEAFRRVHEAYATAREHAE